MLSTTGSRSGIVRGLAVLGVLLVWLMLAGLGGTSTGQLSTVQENDAASFLPQGADSTRAARLAEDFRDDTVLPALVVVEGDGAPHGGAGRLAHDLGRASWWPWNSRTTS